MITIRLKYKCSSSLYVSHLWFVELIHWLNKKSIHLLLRIRHLETAKFDWFISQTQMEERRVTIQAYCYQCNQVRDKRVSLRPGERWWSIDTCYTCLNIRELNYQIKLSRCVCTSVFKRRLDN